tara:strand:+ start:3712 stop:3939 length:228 start_codon:yes stop_codon:yes gene_type:complete
MKRHDHRHPKIGDIIKCADGDIGVVMSTHWRRVGNTAAYELMVEISWSAGGALTDSWRSQDFNTSQNMFHIVSRA